MSINELLDNLRRGEATAAACVTRYGITKEGTDAAIFITVNDEGVAVSCENENYYVDEDGDEWPLSMLQEQQTAAAITTHKRRPRPSNRETPSELPPATKGAPADDEQVLTLTRQQYDLVFGALRLYQNVATPTQRDMVQDIVTNSGLWPEILSPDDPVLLDIFEREGFIP